MPYFFTVVSMKIQYIYTLSIFDKLQGDMSINYKQFHEVESHIPTWLLSTLKTMWANK